MQKEQPQSKQDGNESHLLDIHYLWGVLLDSKALILTLTLLSGSLTLSYGILRTPVYQADTLLQLERNSSDNLFNEINSLLPGGDSSVDTELVLIKSRSVLGKTVSDLGLDTEVNQIYLPLLGKALWRMTGQTEYKVDIASFKVSDELLGTRFVLNILDNDSWLLEGGDLSLQGTFGIPLNEGGVELLVTGTDASPGTRFALRKSTRYNAIENIERSFSARESSADSGMIRLSYRGDNPQEIREILYSLSDNYIEQNIAKKSASAMNSLDFLAKQVPLVKSQLESAENRLSDFRRIHGSVDLPLEARTMLETDAAVSAQLSTLEFEEADLTRLYTKAHPMYQAFVAKKRDLLKTQATLESRINVMPLTQQDILRLTRDVESAQAIYMQLLSKQQELNINKASTVGNIRVIDPAEVLPDPVDPLLYVVVLSGTLAGFLLSIVLVLVRNFFKRVIINSDQIQALGLNVYSSIPFAEPAKRGYLFRSNNKSLEKGKLLALSSVNNLAIEAMRSLRTSLYFQLREVDNKILMVSGPSSEIGKSFVSSNLSAVFAQSGMRVLLVDGDMRRGYLHELFTASFRNGLSDILSADVSAEDCIQPTEVPGLDLIPRGNIPPNPSELLLNNQFAEFCKWANENYDLVVINTPPILAVADAAIIANYSGINLMVARFEVTTPDELAFSVKRFEQEGYKINGVVLNGTLRRNSQYFHQGYYESYQYRPKNDQ